jgi:hypothetical protein
VLSKAEEELFELAVESGVAAEYFTVWIKGIIGQ